MRETRTVEVFICDGKHDAETPAVETANIEGRNLDLCPAHARKYRNTVAAILGTSPNGRKPRAGIDPKMVRAWAAENGVECPKSGRVPAGVLAAYAAR
jgi:hypothetical protein